MDEGQARFGKVRRPRWTPSEDAKALLETIFLADSFPTFAVRQQLAGQLGIDSRQVQIWFQNRRQRERGKGSSGCGKAANGGDEYLPNVADFCEVSLPAEQERAGGPAPLPDAKPAQPAPLVGPTAQTPDASDPEIPPQGQRSAVVVPRPGEGSAGEPSASPCAAALTNGNSTTGEETLPGGTMPGPTPRHALPGSCSQTPPAPQSAAAMASSTPASAAATATPLVVAPPPALQALVALKKVYGDRYDEEIWAFPAEAPPKRKRAVVKQEDSPASRTRRRTTTPSDDKLNISVRDQNGTVSYFTLKPTTPPDRVFNVWSTRAGVCERSVRFFLDGMRVPGYKTPADIDMEEGDQLDCQLEQQGC